MASHLRADGAVVDSPRRDEPSFDRDRTRVAVDSCVPRLAAKLTECSVTDAVQNCPRDESSLR